MEIGRMKYSEVTFRKALNTVLTPEVVDAMFSSQVSPVRVHSLAVTVCFRDNLLAAPNFYKALAANIIRQALIDLDTDGVFHYDSTAIDSFPPEE